MNLHTRLLMTSSAIFMAVLGLGASFLPQEAIAYAAYPVERAVVVLLQLSGAL